MKLSVRYQTLLRIYCHYGLPPCENVLGSKRVITRRDILRDCCDTLNFEFWVIVSNSENASPPNEAERPPNKAKRGRTPYYPVNIIRRGGGGG